MYPLVFVKQKAYVLCEAETELLNWHSDEPRALFTALAWLGALCVRRCSYLLHVVYMVGGMATLGTRLRDDDVVVTCGQQRASLLKVGHCLLSHWNTCAHLFALSSCTNIYTLIHDGLEFISLPPPPPPANIRRVIWEFEVKVSLVQQLWMYLATQRLSAVTKQSLLKATQSRGWP
jgi:hypothetical protein